MPGWARLPHWWQRRTAPLQLLQAWQLGEASCSWAWRLQRAEQSLPWRLPQRPEGRRSHCPQLEMLPLRLLGALEIQRQRAQQRMRQRAQQCQLQS